MTPRAANRNLPPRTGTAYPSQPNGFTNRTKGAMMNETDDVDMISVDSNAVESRTSMEALSAKRPREKSEIDLPSAKEYQKPTRKRISKDEINALPIIAWSGSVRVLNQVQEMKQAVKEIMDSGEKHLGFDIESRPCFKKGDYHPPALVQLATSTCVYLFRICETKSLDPLLPILECANIMKTGVGMKGDIRELVKMRNFSAKGFTDITSLTSEKLGYPDGGLRSLAAIFMKGRVSKGAQMTNWASKDLSKRQIVYAATDAWIGREIYVRAKAQYDKSPSRTLGDQ